MKDLTDVIWDQPKKDEILNIFGHIIFVNFWLILDNKKTGDVYRYMEQTGDKLGELSGKVKISKKMNSENQICLSKDNQIAIGITKEMC